MKIFWWKVEADLLTRKYIAMRDLWHARIDYLRVCDDLHSNPFYRVWLRFYIMQIRRELEDILFQLGRLRKHVTDDCAKRLDTDI